MLFDVLLHLNEIWKYISGRNGIETAIIGILSGFFNELILDTRWI